MTQPIALVGLACVYPDARSPAELWENVLAGRRAFRRIPPERLRAEDYWSADRDAADRTYSVQAALIEGFEFDRVGYQVSGESFRAADLAHWVALDVAARALKDAGLAGGAGLPRDTTGVFLGNTLTGEFSRAQVLRLRWPYARRVVEEALRDEGWEPERCRDFLGRLEARFKAPFPAVGEETLAGGLSNTIAGRICNHFDLKGGGYTVDGACASSLLAVAHACSALEGGDLDAALAGGVDLSLDPFELVGFAKAGALAQEAMRVYDVRSAGFWPGEGCGVVVLMRLADAVAQGRNVAAVIRGWGISSDGQGGITRPEVEGQLLALARAYRRAGFGIETVPYFEGHGTGTSVGDATELRALGRLLGDASPGAPPAVIGSIKANIGHTKAAAGVAGLIKAALALDAQILPPTTGCEQPHPELDGNGCVDQPRLRVLRKGQPWPADRPLRAGVSAMGFGGINAHLVLESPCRERRASISRQERVLLHSTQDAELFLLGARNSHDLRRQVDHLLTLAERLSMAELTDLAACLAGKLEERTERAAIVATRPDELAARLKVLRAWLDAASHNGDQDERQRPLDPRAGIFLGRGTSPPRIGLLFPGQGSPATLDGGAWSRRFPSVEEVYARADLSPQGDLGSTAVAQPAIVAASLAALGLLRGLGIEAEAAVGHSLGEVCALHWAGAFDAATALRIATERGRAMADLPSGAGAMASLAADRLEVETLRSGEPVVIAGLNARRQTVVSGPVDAVDAVIARARHRGLGATRLAVSHAFHSPMMAEAVVRLSRAITAAPIGRPHGIVYSTVTGTRLARDIDVRELLLRQVTAPVRFQEALALAAGGIDLWIEAGPGGVLTALADGACSAPTVAMDAGGDSLIGLLCTVGAAFALGAPVSPEPLLAGRFVRPFSLDWRPRFFINPCELAPVSAPARERSAATANRPDRLDRATGDALPEPAPERWDSVLELVRRHVAKRAELPPESIRADNRLLSDLHLNSITVSQLVTEMAHRLNVTSVVEPSAFADATVGDVARALEEIAHDGRPDRALARGAAYPGVASWFRAFATVWVERTRRPRPVDAQAGPWRVIALPGDRLAVELADALSRARAGRGVVACLPPASGEPQVGLLLQAARALFADPEADRFVLVQPGGGASSFARTLHQELPRTATCVVDAPAGHPQLVDWVVAEAASTAGFVEVRFDHSGRRQEPVLRLLPEPEDSAHALLGPADVMLVTGGGKGIAAECALALARQTGVRLALVGRSRPDADRELAANLERMAASGLNHHYIKADVSDAEAVRGAVRQAQLLLGPITAVAHGAGLNVPCLLGSLDEAAFLQTLAPKVGGARNLLAALPGDQIKLLVTFGSIIARTGLPGEADYAVANESLARLTEQFQEKYPACRCLALEWSVWAGVGMGDRLGRIDSLARQGITPIPLEEGVSLFRRLVASPQPAVRLVVAGRFGTPPALAIEGSELPLLRFLEQPQVDYPGLELVADATLATENDPYLDDHVFRGERLFPAVMGLEAMAQVAMAVLRLAEPPVFEDVRFDRPVVVPRGQSTTIRIAALVRQPGCVDVVLRSANTAFQLDHFRATCRFGAAAVSSRGAAVPDLEPGGEWLPVSVDPESELYGRLLFQDGRFRRLHRYRWLRATGCVAEIGGGEPVEWFGRYLPAEMVLGDPGARDAAIHAIQACIPQAIVLPIGVDRIVRGLSPMAGPCLVSARERADRGDLLIFDVEITDDKGDVFERWDGLKLRVVERLELGSAWPEPLLGPYLERWVRAVLPGSRVAVEVEWDSRAERRARSDRVFQRLLGKSAAIMRRPDGKPEIGNRALILPWKDGDLVAGTCEVSAAHSRDVTLAVAGPGTVACDLEPCAVRSTDVWRDLLGAARWELAQLIARETGQSETEAATRTWVAGECLTKAGAVPTAPLMLGAPADTRAVVLHSGPFAIATLVLRDRKGSGPFVVGLLARRQDACL